MIAYSSTVAIVGNDEDSTYSNYDSNDKSSATSATRGCIAIAYAFYEYEKLFTEIQEFIRLARSKEFWRYERKRQDILRRSNQNRLWHVQLSDRYSTAG